MSDPKPTPGRRFRQFRCHDLLWDVFEEMASDQDRPVDQIIDEAMRAYAKGQGYGVPPAEAARSYEGVITPVRLTPLEFTKTQPSANPAPAAAAVAVPGSVRAPQPAPQPPETLYLTYAGATMLIDKEQFVIGRGAKHSDLAIDDPDVSRRHAAIVRRSNGYYIRDMGSTNGIAFRGMRIDHKRIEEGDVFYICSHEIAFKYRP